VDRCSRNQLVAIEVFFHEEGNFIVGIVPVELSPDRTGIIQPLENSLSISMNAVYEIRAKYMLPKLMILIFTLNMSATCWRV